MGYPTMFYATDDVRESLKLIKNRSELINKLLIEHFNSLITKTEEELLEELRIKKIELEALKKIENGSN